MTPEEIEKYMDEQFAKMEKNSTSDREFHVSMAMEEAALLKRILKSLSTLGETMGSFFAGVKQLLVKRTDKIIDKIDESDARNESRTQRLEAGQQNILGRIAEVKSMLHADGGIPVIVDITCLVIGILVAIFIGGDFIDYIEVRDGVNGWAQYQQLQITMKVGVYLLFVVIGTAISSYIVSMGYKLIGRARKKGE